MQPANDRLYTTGCNGEALLQVQPAGFPPMVGPRRSLFRRTRELNAPARGWSARSASPSNSRRHRTFSAA
jgi:hypothetical protein